MAAKTVDSSLQPSVRPIGCCAPDIQILGSWKGQNDKGATLVIGVGKNGGVNYSHSTAGGHLEGGTSFACFSGRATATKQGYFCMCPECEVYHYDQPKQAVDGVWWVHFEGGFHLEKLNTDHVSMPTSKVQPVFMSPPQQEMVSDDPATNADKVKRDLAAEDKVQNFVAA